LFNASVKYISVVHHSIIDRSRLFPEVHHFTEVHTGLF